VAQNSVLNGRLVRECGFDRVHIPHCVGDEGIAVGCAIYGAHLLATERQEKEGEVQSGASSSNENEAPLVPPYLGKRYSAEEVFFFTNSVLKRVTFSRTHTRVNTCYIIIFS